MAIHQIAVHDAVCNEATEFDCLPIRSLIQAAALYRELSRKLRDESERPVNRGEPASTYFDDRSAEFALKCDDAYAALERRTPNNESEADDKARALLEWYSSTGDTGENVLKAALAVVNAQSAIH